MRGCNLCDSSERWETLIEEYFTQKDNFEPDVEFVNDSANDNGNAVVGLQVQPPPQVRLVSFTEEAPREEEDNNNQSLHVGEAVVAAECKDFISKHVEIKRKKAKKLASVYVKAQNVIMLLPQRDAIINTGASCFQLR